MSVLNKIIALSVVLLIGVAAFAGWRVFSHCEGKGLMLCMAGAMVPDQVTQIVTSEKCREKYGAAAFQDPNGICYQCPDGYEERTIEPVTSNRACKIPGFERIEKATFVASTVCEKRNPDSFFDPRNGGECWSCPKDYSRTIFPITSDKACEMTAKAKAVRHEKHTPFQCPDGQFYDPKGYCYSCDAGLNRTVFSVDSNKACEGLRYDKATYIRNADLQACPKDAFFDPRQGGECWRCPKDYGRSLAAVTSDTACWKTVKQRAERKGQFNLLEGKLCQSHGEFWDPKGAPGVSYCYSCNGLNRTVASIDANNACEGTVYKKAEFVKKAKIEICPKSAFFDPIKGGQCWSCPKGFSRTLDPVTAKTACVNHVAKKAVRHKRHEPFKCPKGQFYDLTGYCYSCDGMQRSLAHVDSGNACVATKHAKAEFHGKGGPLMCDQGAFFDPRNGGECWKCPEGYNRSAAAVDAENACSRSNALDTQAAIELGEPI